MGVSGFRTGGSVGGESGGSGGSGGREHRGSESGGPVIWVKVPILSLTVFTPAALVPWVPTKVSRSNKKATGAPVVEVIVPGGRGGAGGRVRRIWRPSWGLGTPKWRQTLRDLRDLWSRSEVVGHAISANGLPIRCPTNVGRRIECGETAAFIEESVSQDLGHRIHDKRK